MTKQMIRTSALVTAFLVCTSATAGGHRLRSGEHWKPQGTVDGTGMNGVLMLSGQIEGATIGPASIERAYRVIETAKEGATLRNVKITGLQARNLDRDGIRLRGDVDGVTIEDFDLQMRDEPQTRPNLPEGIAIMSGRNITIRNGRVSGFRLEHLKGRYPNGDGIAAERPVTGLQITNVESSGNADGGFDLKSSGTELDRLIARRNHRNFRFWGRVEAGTLTSIDPGNAHIWLGRGAIVHIKHLVASSTGNAPLLRIEGAKEVRIDRCDLHLPAKAPVVVGRKPGVIVQLGPGCSRRSAPFALRTNTS